MTKTELYIKHALQLGWYVTDAGEVYNSKGSKVNIRLRGSIGDAPRKRYPRVNLSINDTLFAVEVHKLVAAFFLGDYYWEAKKQNLQVRHLDGNVLNLSRNNITMGTAKENNLDKPKHIRLRACAIARSKTVHKQLTCPHCRKSGSFLAMRRWHFDRCSAKTLSTAQ